MTPESTTESTTIIMIDIETLGIGAGAPVLQLAVLAMPLDDEEAEPILAYEEYLPLQPQQRLGRYADMSTILWWFKQDDKARGKIAQYNDSEDSELLEGMVKSYLNRIRHLITQAGEDYEVWCRGTNFDPPIIESLAVTYGISVPWRYDKVFDLRTLMKATGTPKGELLPGTVLHHALSDCRNQMRDLFEARRRLHASH